ncbi:MAG: bifunctional methylenetetrahydrofolate dehydrogenase/methenyltetrahydrofolate cyclohydrolase FolD [Angelakisella sp.]|nr:bifunctional methylenetetrahydrofolate dehydrogenase/methenyltetrahydrofolate cyclohydrolase FolD [Angelakisella sp.]
MSAKIIDGKQVAARCREELKQQVAALRARGIIPGLAVILVGEDPASQVYVRNKHRACEELGIHSEQYTLSADTDRQTLLDLITELNGREEIDGILVQLPLPGHLDEKEILSAIDPAKDVDSFHPQNVGRLVIGDYFFAPCTPSGILTLIDSAGVDLTGKECVVIGRSNIVGKPMALMLLHRNATVTVCHSKTRDLPSVTRRADVLISAVGKAGFVTAYMVKPGAVVIDVGMNRNQAGKLCGDVDFESVSRVAGYLTPVPGGVGPMTITMLLRSTVLSAQNRRKKQ